MGVDSFFCEGRGIGCPGDSAGAPQRGPRSALRPLPTSPASPRGGNLYPSGPSPYICPGVDKPPDTLSPSQGPRITLGIALAQVSTFYGAGGAHV